MLPLTTILFLLAGAAPPSDATIPLAVVVTLLTAVISAACGKKVGEKQKVSIAENPLNVSVTDQFVTRREYDEFRVTVSAQTARLEATMQRQADNVERKHLQLIQTIEVAQKNGLNGRVALWEDVKEIGEKLAGVTAQLPIADELAKTLKLLQQRERAAIANLKKKGATHAEG